MDLVQFKTEGLEYNVEFRKRRKIFSYSEYGQYICSIIFKNDMDQIVLQIDCTEKEFYDATLSLNYFCMNIGSTISDIIHFDSSGDLRQYFWYINFLDNVPNYPYEEDERMCISIFESINDNNILRLYFEMSYYALENFVYNMFLLVEDLKYLFDMNYNDLLEFIGYYESNICD